MISSAARWAHSRLVEPLRTMSLRLQVLCVLVGVLGGLFPIPMLTTVVTAALASLVGLSAPALAVAASINLVMTPAELLLLPAFVTCGRLVVPSSLVGSADAEALLRRLTEGASWSDAGQALVDLTVLACVPWAAGCGALLAAAMVLLPSPDKEKKA